MSYGPMQVFTGTIASGATICTQIRLPKAFSQVFVEFSTMSTAAAVDVWGSTDGTTFRPLLERVNTAPVQYQTLTVASGVGSGGGAAPLTVIYPYMQFIASAAIAGGCTIKLVGVD